MKKEKLIAFQEKVQPLSKDEQGQLRGGFTDVDMDFQSEMIGNKNKGLSCKNQNCSSSDTKNKLGMCTNVNCRCVCSGDEYVPTINSCLSNSFC